MRRIVRPGRRARIRVPSRRLRSRPSPQSAGTVQPGTATATKTPSSAKARDSVTSLTLIGPTQWRDPLARWIEYESNLTLSTEFEPENRPRHVFDLPSSDVVIAYADAVNPDPVVELALELQAKDRGTGIILVLSGLREDMARRFSAYAGSWSLVTSKTSADPVRLNVIIQSSARGMPVVDPAVTKMIEAGWRAGSSDDQVPETSVEPGVTAANETI